MSRRSKSNSGENTVDKEVANLFSIKDKSQYNRALMSLRQKYRDDDLVNRIQQVFVMKHRMIVKGAKKFAEAFRKRYGANDIPYHQLLDKARAHAKKHKIGGDAFAEFQRMYEQELAGTSKANEVVMPVTNLMKVLGNISTDIEGSFNIPDEDYHYVNDIMMEWEVSRPLHAQTILQGLQYTDVGQTALIGIINRGTQNPGDHIHPVIAAMFIPKIDLFESHFLHSNIARIVRARCNQESLTTKPDYELFYNMVTDPNDIVCDNRAPMGDLLNRSRLQQHLWNSVLHLRNGQFYNPSFNEFIRSVDNCRLNKFDNPDFTYGRHDGTVIKRLLSAFSFRPTVIATIPITNVFIPNPYGQNIRPTITSIPMINVRLSSPQYQPAAFGMTPQPVTTNTKLSNCLTQPQTFIEGNTLVSRISQVVYSREVLIFYIDRRAHLLQFGQPFNISRLPSAIAGFEKINKTSIDFECSMNIKSSPQSTTEETFCLRSVVIADVSTLTPTTADPRNVVVGSSAFIFDYPFDPVDTNKKYCKGIGKRPGAGGAAAIGDNGDLNFKWDVSLFPKNNEPVLKSIKDSILFNTTLPGARQLICEPIINALRGYLITSPQPVLADQTRLGIYTLLTAKGAERTVAGAAAVAAGAGGGPGHAIGAFTAADRAAAGIMGLLDPAIPAITAAQVAEYGIPAAIIANPLVAGSSVIQAVSLLADYLFILMSNNCGSAQNMYYYDPANALISHSPYVIYDILGNQPAAGVADRHRPYAIPPGAPVAGKAPFVAAFPLIDPVRADGADITLAQGALDRIEAVKRVCEQGVIFIYQNFNYNSDITSSITF